MRQPANRPVWHRMCQSLRRELLCRLRRLCKPLLPRPTSLSPKIRRLAGIRAVIFDIYGTLLISRREPTQKNDVAGGILFERALRAAGFVTDARAGSMAQELFYSAIEAEHIKARVAGVNYPEVDIGEIWRVVLSSLQRARLLKGRITGAAVVRTAVEHEGRANPVWPMPGAKKIIRWLADQKIILGTVSNAQFYTPLLLELFLGTGFRKSYFDPFCCIWSWEHRVAKPSPQLFQIAAEALHNRYQISPHEALYIGNDMLNDVWASGLAGFRTGLFAGDQRSLCLRSDDPKIRSVTPDLIVTEWKQIPIALRTT